MYYAPPPAYYPPPPPPEAYYAPPPAYVPPPEPNPGVTILQQALKSLPQIISAAKAPPAAPPAYAAAPPPPPVSAVPVAPDPTVRWVQQSLNVLTHAGLNVDGIAGASTTNAIVSFQLANGLAADGIAGDATIAAITRQLNAAGEGH